MEFEIGVGQCVFGFRVDVPDDRTFYSVEVAARGGVTYSRAELQGLGWSVEISLGRCPRNTADQWSHEVCDLATNNPVLRLYRECL